MKEKINIIKNVVQKRKADIIDFARMETTFQEIALLINKNTNIQSQFEKSIIDIVLNVNMADNFRIYLLSALAKISKKADYMEMLLEYIDNMETLDLYSLENILHQINGLMFNFPSVVSERVREMYDKLYNIMTDVVKSAVEIEKKEKNERNRNRVIVMANQIIGERHAPTHSALERCAMLRKCGYDVTLISTGEGSRLGRDIWFYEQKDNNIIEDYNGFHAYPYEGEKYFFYQEEKSLLRENGIYNIIDVVREINPYFILFIGGRSYLTEILDKYCPVVTVATVFSTIPKGNTTFSVVGRNVTNEEREKHQSEIIEIPFSFTLTEKKKTYTRKEFSIPEDKFVAVVVGNRLDADVDIEFIECLKKVSGLFVVFIGKYETYSNCCDNDNWLGENSISLGKYDDVMGVLEVCDLYVNPKRLGGGFSVIEGFHAGIPAVSINYGDVSVAAGSPFCVENYAEMINIIEKYRDDKEFYDKMVEKAKYREKDITDGQHYFEEAIGKIINSEKFF